MSANANGWHGPPIKALDEAKTGRLGKESNAEWRAPAPHYRGGVMAKYAALVGSASEGAVTTGPRMTAGLG